MNKPWDIVKELEDNNSRLVKESIIKREMEAFNAPFFDGFYNAYNAMITFGIKKVPESTTDGDGISSIEFWQMAEQLASRTLTGNAAIEKINDLCKRSNSFEWNYWYRRILIKDMRCGTSDTIINKIVKDVYPSFAVPVFSVQLAKDSANHEGKLTGKKMIDVKLDGCRCITIVYPNGKVNQYSRNGKELLNFPTITEQISKVAASFTEPMVLDGEVMSSSFQDLMKQVYRKSDVQTDDAVLNLFDAIPLYQFLDGISECKQSERSADLEYWYDSVKDSLPNVNVIGYEVVDLDTEEGQQRFITINAKAIEMGLEGVMIKNPDAKYETRRTDAWLKMKPFIEVTLEIIGVEEGEGKYAGMLGAIVCQGMDDGKLINVTVGSGFSDKQRIDFWHNRAKIILDLVEVRADAITQNALGTYSLRFPRFKTFRGLDIGSKI